MSHTENETRTCVHSKAQRRSEASNKREQDDTRGDRTGGDGIRHDRTEDKIKLDGVGWGRIGQDVQTSRERPCFPKWEANEIM